MGLRLWLLENDESNDEKYKETFLSSLNEEQRYTFEERAAIMEYDGGLTREQAEQEAMKAITKNLPLFVLREARNLCYRTSS